MRILGTDRNSVRRAGNAATHTGGEAESGGGGRSGAWSGRGFGARRPTGPPESLAALWAQDLPARERAVWLLILESSAPVTAVLALDIQDLDLSAGQARTGRHVVSFAPGGTAATVLPPLCCRR